VPSGAGTSHSAPPCAWADPEPGREAQADFGRMGLMFDPASSRRRVVHALILVAVWSRHMFVWLSYTQTTADVIEGFEHAWKFFGGVFPIIIPDNLTPVITKADPTEPRINDTFLEYSQDRGFLVDAARARHPKDKARCERQVPFVRGRFFAGEDFVDLAEANRRAESWCALGAGMRTHRSTQCRPAEAFRSVEQPLLLAAPASTYETPAYSEPKVHRDHDVEVARAIYTVPGDRVGQRISARADSKTVKLYVKGELIKVHPRQPPGGRSTDPADLPSDRTAYAMRDISYLIALGRGHREAIGAFLTALMDHPLPWTKMRQAYRLLGLVKKWGGAHRGRLCPGTGSRGGEREPGRAHARAGQRSRRARQGHGRRSAEERCPRPVLTPRL